MDITYGQVGNYFKLMSLFMTYQMFKNESQFGKL